MNEGRKGCTFAKGSKGQKREIERERDGTKERERDGDVQEPYLTNFSLRFMQKGRIQRMLSCFISRITVL